MAAIGDVVNIRKPGDGYWQGTITDISTEWTHKLNNGEVLQQTYTNPIATIKEINGVGYATCMVTRLEMKNGEYYNTGTED